MTLFHGLSRKIRHNPWLRGLPNEVAIIALIAFFVAIGFGIVAPAIPVFAKSFGVTAFAASWGKKCFNNCTFNCFFI